MNAPRNLTALIVHRFADGHREWVAFFGCADGSQVSADYQTYMPAHEYRPALFRPACEPPLIGSDKAYYSQATWASVPADYQRVISADALTAQAGVPATLVPEYRHAP